jgi:hypothetical protein
MTAFVDSSLSGQRCARDWPTPGEPPADGEWRAREHVTERCTTDGTGGPRLAALFAGAGAAT